MRASISSTREPMKPESRPSSEQGLVSAVNLVVPFITSSPRHPWLTSQGLRPCYPFQLLNVAEGFTAVCSWSLTTQEQAMNTFCEHHQNSIKFGYRCFDRILLNGLIQPFQQPERVIGFFNAYRQGQRVTRNLLRDIAQQFQNWVKNRCQKWGAPILDAPQGRRDDFVDPYFRHAKKDKVVVILKAREPARIMVAIGRATELLGKQLF